MKVHHLKEHPGPFGAVLLGLKPYEVRKNDRGYEIGDVLHLREWAQPLETETEACGYTGRCATVVVGYMTGGGEWGLPPDLCVLGFDLGKLPWMRQSCPGESCFEAPKTEAQP